MAKKFIKPSHEFVRYAALVKKASNLGPSLDAAYAMRFQSMKDKGWGTQYAHRAAIATLRAFVRGYINGIDLDAKPLPISKRV